MAVWFSRARAACALVFVVVAAVGCSSLPDLFGETNHDCSFGMQSSQAACQAVAAQATCSGAQWQSADQSCTGTSCSASVATGTPPNTSYRYCGNGNVIGASLAQTPLKSWVAGVEGTGTAAAGAGTGAGAGGAIATPVSRAMPGFKAAGAVTISEFALPVADMEPGPIVVSGQRMLFAAVETCQSATNCPNSGVFSVDTGGKVAFVEGLCANGGDACRITGLAPLGDGGYCFNATRIVVNFNLLPDTVSCTGTGFKVAHPVRPLNGFLAGLGLGYDGKVWYVDGQFSAIGRLTANDPAAVQSTYLRADASNLGLATITAGPDQAMWFTATFGNQIGRINGSGYTMVTLPIADSRPVGIVLGADGNLWFTEFMGNKIGRITPAGVVTEFALPTAGAGAMGIAAGPDGALYFTEFNANKIGRITTSGTIDEYAIPTMDSQPAGIVAGPDGNLWFTEFQGNNIGRITPPPAQPLPQVVEFYNVNLDTYFITANAAEQAAIDGGSAGPGWNRTGGTFASGGSTSVCRFYGSVVPGPNSHFYTADADECAQLKQIQAATPATQKRWNFESLDFQTTPASNSACPANLVPVYRAYNNGSTRGIDSNHRITTSQSAIADVVKRGWSSEGVVMCAPQQ